MVKPKEHRMESRNLRLDFRLFHSVKKELQTNFPCRSALMRVLIGSFAVLLITVKLAAPFLHTHQTDPVSERAGLSISHCEACEYEATQADGASVTVALPVVLFEFEIKVFRHHAPRTSSLYSSSDSRGSPKAI